MMLVHDTHRGRSMVPAPFNSKANWCGNWCVVPPLKVPSPQIQRQEFKRKNWHQDAGMRLLKTVLDQVIDKLDVPKNCSQHQQLKHRTVNHNFEMPQASRKYHHVSKATVNPCTVDAGSSEQRKTTKRKVDGPTGDIPSAVELSFKRRKTDHQSSEEIHPHQRSRMSYESSEKSMMRGNSLTSLKPKPDEKQTMGEVKNDNACQLCGVEKLFFEIRCFSCGILFNKRDKYHSASNLGVECRCCNACSIIEGKKPSVPGVRINKEKISLDTDLAYQEPFVLCDRCGGKQHHSCALFNNERNVSEGKSGYTCPKCDINQLEDDLGGAIHLKRTKLSDFLEDRLCSSLRQEREERAKAMGKNSDEVPGAENLVVRVVSSVEKSVLVNPEIHNVLKDANYPEKLSYRSKVILLFQKIDGVDVCLFGMYVQEYGSKCAHPNQRSIYISYLDSVKYFQPDGIRTATGEPLRTFVYQEILVGYLDYCKRRGFSKCYLWSCPPSKADQYIFYSHPGKQKNPSSEILRDWYRKMLNKAKGEGIVADVTNYYDYFFKRNGKHKVKAARLPYFEGDYWPSTAEAELKKLIDEIVPSVRRTRKQRPSSEAVRCTDDSGNPPLGDKLMEKLGEKMKKQKQNFIIVDLGTQHMAADTDQEEDEVIEGSLFSVRDNFLDLSKKKHYQFNNLQRAKHSTKMILHHLRNPDIAQEEV